MIVDDLSDLEIPGQGEPVRHVDRPVPPWEDSPVTMCGRTHTDVQVVVTREAASKLARKIGVQRAGVFLCLSCIDRLRYRGGVWERKPVEVTQWWLERHQYRQTAQSERAAVTLLALGQLVDRHREEFEALRDPDVTRLDAARQARTRRNR